MPSLSAFLVICFTKLWKVLCLIISRAGLNLHVFLLLESPYINSKLLPLLKVVFSYKNDQRFSNYIIIKVIVLLM